MANGEKVILISDMYLPSKDIRDLIGNVDPVLAKLPLYVSSEIGHKKDNGKLFVHIFFDLDYEFSEWVHYGDNVEADGARTEKTPHPRNHASNGCVQCRRSEIYSLQS